MFSKTSLLVLFSSLLFTASSGFAQTLESPLEECELDTYEDFCERNGLVGICQEEGPNGCPDPDAACNPFPYCSLPDCDGAEPGEPCTIERLNQENVEGVCRMFCDVDEYTGSQMNCDNQFCDPVPRDASDDAGTGGADDAGTDPDGSDAGSSGTKADPGCSSTPAAPAPGWLTLLAMGLVWLVRRRS